MKTMAYKYLKFLMVAVALANLSSCDLPEDSFVDDDNIGGYYYEKSKALCSYIWVDEFTDVDGNYCYQELTFFLDRHGKDYFCVEYPDGTFTEDIYDFVWRWEDRDQYSLRMYYGPGDISYMDDVWVSGRLLRGYLDDNYVDFKGEK